MMYVPFLKDKILLQILLGVKECCLALVNYKVVVRVPIFKIL